MSRLLERLAADAWPPVERVDADGRRLRAACGVTTRANSALPLDPPGPGLAAVERFYDDRGQVPRVQAPDDAWLACWWDVDGRGGPAGLEVARTQLSLLARPAPYVSVVVEQQVVAVGRGVVDSGWLGVFAMAVRPGHRRRGLGSQVLDGLGTWARGVGAAAAYLQVLVDNEPARALYAGRGFRPAYGYHYRSRP